MVAIKGPTQCHCQKLTFPLGHGEGRLERKEQGRLEKDKRGRGGGIHSRGGTTSEVVEAPVATQTPGSTEEDEKGEAANQQGAQ
jgi:hypothetical protein